MVALAFNAQGVAPAEPGLPIWDGAVPVEVTKTEAKPTAKNDGSGMLVLTLRALAGPHAGSQNVVRLNIWNKSPQAVDIAQRELSAICHCSGRMNIQDSDNLLGAQFVTVWERGERDVTDQKTGQTHKVPNCECKEYRLLDGRTIKEAMAGQPASSPMQSGGQAPQPPQGQPQGPQGGGFAPQGQAQGAPGFGQPGGAPPAGFQPGAGPQGAPATGTGGFATGGAPAPGPSFGTQAQPGSFGTAGGPPSAAPQGFGGAPQAGFGAGPQGGPPAGFGAPQGQPQGQGGGFGAPGAGQGFGGAPTGGPQWGQRG